jgi:hypothetical protein
VLYSQKKMMSIEISLPHAWIILAKHKSDDTRPGYKLMGVLDNLISGPAMLEIVRALYSSYLQGLARKDSDSRVEPTTISYKFLNDGSPWEDWIVCWGQWGIGIEAIRAHDVSMESDEHNAIYLKWQMEHLIVYADNTRETDFWESYRLPIDGIHPLTNYEEA